MVKIIAVFHVVALLLLSQTLRADEAVATEGAYKIQPGDVLEVSVWKEEGLSKQVLVRPDGGISFPLAGNVVAAGKSVDELQSLITEQLTKYIPDPVVTVSTQTLSGNNIYVIGQVAQPGAFVANRYMDVVQALSVARGLTPFAAANKIKVLRRVDGQLIAIPFRYGDIEKGENLEQNIMLQSGDVVLVP